MIPGGELQLLNHTGTTATIAASARVSIDFDGVQAVSDDDKLVRYLFRHRHSTPFEHCTLTYRVQCPIFVARQWHRHRTQSYNEASARYGQVPEHFYLPESWHAQAKQNKQARGPRLNKDAQLYCTNQAERIMEEAYRVYCELLEVGAAREQARIVLPQGMFTSFWATANLWNWIRFCDLRCAPDSQYEIRVYADQIKADILRLFPELEKVWQ